MSNRWIVYPKKTDDIIDQLLLNRRVDLKYKEIFLNPDFYKNTFDPFDLPNIGKAIKRIKQAITNKEKIGLFVDYDADGIPGGAILYKLFQYLKTTALVYIPTRDEGYGLNQTGIKYFSDEGVKLIITVDLGITNKAEINFANKLGVDVIVTDHHEIQAEKMPTNAYAIVHPRLPGSKYPNGNLSGGAVAWKLAWAIAKDLKNDKLINQIKWMLDLVSITLVCDNMILSGAEKGNVENRVMVKYGIKVLKKTHNLGIRKIYEIGLIDSKIISTYTIGYQIGPRINAPGRLNHGTPSFMLLTTDDEIKAIKLAKDLNQMNIDRQDQLSKILKKAKLKIKEQDLEKNRAILIYGKNWPAGIIGLIAGKLLEEYHRPIIVFSEVKGILHGSARSIEKFNILEALKKFQQNLIKFGGHKVAAGLTLKLENFEKFYKKLENFAREKISDHDIIPQIKIDAQINLKQITYKLFNDIQKFEPFGIGNPRPVFLTKNIQANDLRTVGKDNKHLKIKIGHKTIDFYFDCIGFNLGNWHGKLKARDYIDIVYNIDENIWNGAKNLQLIIKDLKKSDGENII